MLGVVRCLPFAFVLLLALSSARGQQAVSSINESRLFAPPTAASTSAVTSEDEATGAETTTSGDESFGTQLILKSQERPKQFAVFDDVSVIYTNNVDLTPDHYRSDAFIVANTGAAWRPGIARGFFADISIAGSIFRHDRASELDFERISSGAGLNWIIPGGHGVVAFGRYDFTELIDTHGSELLQDHEFTLGAQRTFAFNRSHFLTTGVSGIAGISDPHSQQRDQVTVNAAYHLQVTRSFSTDLLYRYAAQFYADDGRIDHNQTLSLNAGVAVNRWLRLDATLSGARNDSNRDEFEYEALSVAGAIRVGIRF
jgi:hypothetical protein